MPEIYGDLSIMEKNTSRLLHLVSQLLDFRKIENKDFQGNAVVNYTEAGVPFTRIIEHKHFNFKNQKDTVISWEYPIDYKRGIEPYYPVNDETNAEIYKKYRNAAASIENVFFGGRLAEYKYYDMHQVIASALSDLEKYHNVRNF